MAKKNGTWKVIATIGSFIIVAIGAAMAYGILYKTVDKMEPEVQKNTTYRLQDEIDTIGVKKDIERLSKQVGAIETAQTTAFKEILKRLPE